MLSILGLGGASPAQTISIDFFARTSSCFSGKPEAFPLDVESVCGDIVSRATSLPLEYILKTGNRDPFNTHRFATESPTDLAFRAAEQAMNRAGITSENVGLIIGDSCTPMESTPSEGQRLGKRLGIKVPAYDVWGSSSSFALHLSVLMSRKPESLPPYVLGTSANVPTQSVCYGGQSDARYHLPQYLFGDSAACWVTSHEKQGKLLVREAVYLTEPGHSQQFYIDTYGFLGLEPHFYASALVKALEKAFEMVFSQHRLDPSRVKVVASYSNPVDVHRIIANYEINPQNCWFTQQHVGESLGASPAYALAHHWDDMKSGDSIAVVCAGAGLSYGYVLLEVC